MISAVAEGRLLGAFAVEDQIRPESHEAVTELHRLVAIESAGIVLIQNRRLKLQRAPF